MKIAVYPGTFDPITNGHIDIIRRASKIVDRLIVAVSKDIKIKNHLFNQNERVEMVKHDITTNKINNVEVVPFNSSLINFVRENKISFIIRGIRNSLDFENEFNIAKINYEIYDEIDTIFLPSINATQIISSGIVKQIFMLGGDISKFVSKNTESIIKKKFNNIL